MTEFKKKVHEEYKEMLVSLVGKLEHYPEVMSQCFKELEYMSHAQQYLAAAEMLFEAFKRMKEKNSNAQDNEGELNATVEFVRRTETDDR